MKYALASPTKNGKSFRRILPMLLLAMIMGVAISGTAHADRDDRGRGHDWDHHARDAGRWHHAHPYYVPGYVEPPPVVYYPPPQPSPGINLILPLHFH